MKYRHYCCVLLTLLAADLSSAPAVAQELTPRAYWPAPKGTNVAVITYQTSRGDVVTDPTLPIEGAKSSFEFTQLTYQRTASLFARTANVQINLPYSRGTAQGFVEGEFRERHVAALADARFRLSINLSGAPSMDASEFQELRANPRPIVGVSVLVQAPTGGYEPDRYINAGSNRWAVKPAVGAILPLRPALLFEFELGAWIFDDNEEFVGTVRQQDPILSAEVHLVKRVRPGFWASVDLNYYSGGRTTVDDVDRSDRQSNSRLGLTLAFPFKRQHALRFSYSSAVLTEAGGDYDNLNLSYVYAW